MDSKITYIKCKFAPGGATTILATLLTSPSKMCYKKQN